MQLNLGSAGGVTKATSKGGGCSIGGILIGILLIPLGFYLVYHGEVKLINHGKVFEAVEMMTTEAAKALEGEPVKFKGIPEGDWLTVDYYDKPVVYFSKRIEQYERHEDDEGNVEYDWESSDESTSKWASFTLDGVKVSPGNAKAVGAHEVFVGIKPENSWRDEYDASIVDSHDPEVGDKRLTLRVIDTGEELIVFGDMASSSVSSGRTFVISALDDGATAQQLKTEYTIFYWMLKVGAVFAIAIGILMVFGPLLTLVGYIPFIGTRLTGAFGALAFGFAIVAVLIATVLIKLFWVLVIIAVVGIAVGIWVAVKSPRTPPGVPETPSQPAPAAATQPAPTPAPTPTPAAPMPAPQPAAPPTPEPSTEEKPKFCSNCGAAVEPDDKHCSNCGHDLTE